MRSASFQWKGVLHIDEKMAAARQLLSAEMSKMDLLPAGKMKTAAATLIILFIAVVSATVEDVAATYVLEVYGMGMGTRYNASPCVGTPISGGFRMRSIIGYHVGSIIEITGRLEYSGLEIDGADGVVGTNFFERSAVRTTNIYINGNFDEFLHKQVNIIGRLAKDQYIVVQQIHEDQNQKQKAQALMEKQHLGDIWIGVGLSTVIFFSILFTLLVFWNLEKRRKNCRKHVPFRLIT